MPRTSDLRKRGQEKCVPIASRQEETAFDVKVVECEVSDAPERWRELLSYLLEVDAAQ
jgi:hypothetical protein